jgi:hypothetical protein
MKSVLIHPITTKSTAAHNTTTKVYPAAFSCGTFISTGSPL